MADELQHHRREIDSSRQELASTNHCALLGGEFLT